MLLAVLSKRPFPLQSFQPEFFPNRDHFRFCFCFRCVCVCQHVVVLDQSLTEFGVLDDQVCDLFGMAFQYLF